MLSGQRRLRSCAVSTAGRLGVAVVMSFGVPGLLACQAEGDAKPANATPATAPDQPATTPAATTPQPGAPGAEEEEEEEPTPPVTPGVTPPAGSELKVEKGEPREPKSSGSPEDEAKVAAFRGDYHFLKGDKLFKFNQFVKAALEFREAMKYQPKNVKYAEKMAEASAQARNYPLAIEGYEAILKLEPTRKKELVREIADCYFNLKQYDAACDKYKIAAETAADKGELWRKIANIRMGQSKQDEAILAYRQAIKADPHDGQSYTKLALILSNSGRRDEAFGVYRDGVRNVPKDGDLQEAYAYALMAKQDYRAAADAYKQAALCKGSTPTINAGYQSALKFVEYEDQVAKQKADQAAREAAKASKKHH